VKCEDRFGDRRSKQRGLVIKRENVRGFESEPAKGLAACRWKRRSERGSFRLACVAIREEDDPCVGSSEGYGVCRCKGRKDPCVGLTRRALIGSMTSNYRWDRQVQEEDRWKLGALSKEK